MGESAQKFDRKFTYRDYLNTKEGEGIEIIDGIVYNMVAPSRIHQEISMNFSRVISNYLLDKECRIYAAPFDVRLIKEGQTEDEIDCVVQPDISIILEN